MPELSPKEIAEIAIDKYKAQQKPEELTALLERLELLQPKVILEIGFGSGGTAWAFSQLPSVEYLFSLSIEERAHPTIERISDHIKENSKAIIRYITGNSVNRGTLDSVKFLLNEVPVDFLHIDGSHDYEFVKADYELYSPLVRPGGIVALHDCVTHAPETKCEVERFCKELTAEMPEEKHFNIISEPYNWGGYKVVVK